MWVELGEFESLESSKIASLPAWLSPLGQPIFLKETDFLLSAQSNKGALASVKFLV